MKLFDTITNLITWRFRHNACFFRKMTGYYCPGCGGSRSIMFLLRGDPLRSFIYHPAPLYILIMAFVFIFQILYTVITRKKLSLVKPVHGYILIGLILISWMIKNIMLALGADFMTISLGSFFSTPATP